MTEIISVNFDTQTVSARDLHEKLNIGTKFTTWFERMCEYGFSEGIEFFPKLGETSEQGGRPSVDYDISVDMAKQICMIQRTPEGKACRQYLIDLEKAWNTPEQIMSRALKIAEQTIHGLKNKVLEMKPKAEFFDAVADSKTAISMNEVAKVLDYKCIGRNKLFEFLRDEGILDKYNVPYQRYVDCGWFRVIEQKYMRDGEPHISTKTLVYQKGVDAIRKRLDKSFKEEKR